jgi:hypothetical protein
MKKTFVAFTTLAILSTALHAENSPHGTGLLGFNCTFSGSCGLTAQVVSTSKENAPAASAGVIYYFSGENTGQLGAMAGVVYNAKNVGLNVGYDFLNETPVYGAGFVNTTKEEVPVVN